MNKEELRKDYKDKGWRVEAVSKWVHDHDEIIDNVHHKFYTLNVKSKDSRVGTVKVSVVNEGHMNNEGRVIESCKPIGWETELVPFEDALRDYLDQYEADTAGVFATSLTHVYVEDELAEVVVYNKKANDVEATPHIVKRRDNLFTIKKFI